MTSAEFTVLFVCTGNVCRSPMAEHMLRRGLADRLGDDATRFRVESAGTGALAGDPMTEHSAAVLAEHGIVAADTDAFRGRQLDADHVAAANLILALTRDHRMNVAMVAPDAVPKTFTLTEFALLAREVDPTTLTDTDPIARAREVTTRALELRGTVQPASPHALDIADPYMQSLDVFRNAADQLDKAIMTILDVLVGS